MQRMRKIWKLHGAASSMTAPLGKLKIILGFNYIRLSSTLNYVSWKLKDAQFIIIASIITICNFFVSLKFWSTGDPRISWFQNSWSLLFRDSVSGTNFVNSSPFHDFQKKTLKKNYYKKLIYIFCRWSLSSVRFNYKPGYKPCDLL